MEIKPVFLTSIAPKHVIPFRQSECVKSWQQHGDVISLNHPEEIEQIADKYPGVTFVPTLRTQKALLGKHYVCFNALVDYIRDQKLEAAIIINSDIEMPVWHPEILLHRDSGLVYLHRWDYDETFSEAKFYVMGIDAWVINHKWADRLPQTMYTLGQTFFDLYVPYAFHTNKIPCYTNKIRPIIYHKNHPAQYSAKDWDRFGNYTGFLLGKKEWRPDEVSRYLYASLKQITNPL